MRSYTDMSIQIDVVVIGAGPGGYAAAFYAADRGLSVALVDPEANPGGVCVYRGCIPSKALLHVAKVLDEAAHASAWGVTFGAPAIDVNKLRGFKDNVVKQLTSGTGQLVKARKVKYLRGTATLLSPTSLEVALTGGGSEQVSFGHAIVAVGSQPAKVPVLSVDSPRIMDSTSALDLESVPKSLLVIGGGYIGLELGSVYAALGSKVTVVEMTAGLLPGADRDLVAVLAKRIEKVCDAVLLNTKVVGVVEEKDGVRVTFEDSTMATRDQVFEKVLVSVGRKPNAMAGLDKTKAETDQRGFIKINLQRRTAEPTIFAIGDVAGEPMLAHKASHEGRVAVEAILGEDVAFEPAAIPAVVFTDPELAWAGLTETEAQKLGKKVEISKFPWIASGRAMSIDRTDGLTKLVIEPGSERVLGVGIVGPGAGEMIAEGTLAIEMGAVASDLKLTIHAHPTLSETLMEAAEAFFGQATHIHRPKRK
jgi:dihydrolipoamide dehydrogenase